MVLQTYSLCEKDTVCERYGFVVCHYAILQSEKEWDIKASIFGNVNREIL